MHDLHEELEKLSRVGSYETDLTTGKWKGSKQFIEIFGLPEKEEYTVEEFQALVHPDDYDDVMAYFADCLVSGKYFNKEYRCLKPDGEIIHVISRSNIIRDESGEPIKVIGIKQDITEQKSNELRLNKLNEQNIRKNEVLATAAHDLRSPILQIKGILQLLKLQDSPRNKQLQTFIDEAFSTSENIISELVHIAEMEDEAFHWELQELDLNEVINATITHYHVLADQKAITLDTDFVPDVFIKANKLTLSRLIDNILSNAIKYTNRKGHILISTVIENDMVGLSVKDNGIGMPEEQLKANFEKFTKHRRKGTAGESTTGLGLYIIKQIAEGHKATIEIKSEEGVGTDFCVWFKTKS